MRLMAILHSELCAILVPASSRLHPQEENAIFVP